MKSVVLATLSRADTCLFCGSGSDCLEHIAMCPTIIEFYRSHDQQLVGLHGLLALYPNDSPLKLVSLVRLLGAAYLAHNVLTHHPGTHPQQLLHELPRRVLHHVHS